MRIVLIGLATMSLVALFGCAPGTNETETPPEPEPTIMFFNITSGAVEDPHAVTMALQLAGHSLADGREVVLFFNVRGAAIPTTNLPADLAFSDRPIAELLDDLIDLGVEAHVCPHCMNALGIAADELVPGASVTDREKLFAMLGANTVVFTY